MAKSRRTKQLASAQPSTWEAFAAMSRNALPAPARRAAKPKGKRAGVRAAPPQGTTRAAQAASQAIELGRRQAEWVIEQRRKQLARRTKAMEGRG